MFVDILPPRGLEALDVLSATLPMDRFYLGRSAFSTTTLVADKFRIRAVVDHGGQRLDISERSCRLRPQSYD